MCDRSLKLEDPSERISDARKALTSNSMFCDGTFSVQNLTSLQYFCIWNVSVLLTAECWFHLQTVDESPAIKYVGPTPDVTPNAAPETAIRHVVPLSAVTYTSPAPVIEYVAPTPDASLDETSPASEHMAPARHDTFEAPAPVTRYVAPAPSDTDTTPESMTEYVAPAPAVYYATPAPPIEFVTPSPVIEYSAPAPSVTCFTPSPQLPFAYTMADLSSLVSPLTPHVR